MRPFPWRRAMVLGLGVLRLPPAAFWSMTPRELEAALEGLRGGAVAPDQSMGRAALGRLMARYPDEPKGGPPHG